mgnify:CR=1 FL=1
MRSHRSSPKDASGSVPEKLPEKLPENLPEDWQREGLAKFCVGEAFFRQSSRTGRDLAILCAIAHKTHPANPKGILRIIDAMTGCGVRPLRYALEAGADTVWANEGNWELRDRLQANLSHSLSSERYCITHQDANALFFDCYQRKDFYDLVDIDCFGSPMPALSTSLWAVKLGGLLYLTSTDGRVTRGRAIDKGLQTYGAYARSQPAVHEQGFRLLIGTAVQQAAAKGLSASPVFSWYHGEVNRVMVRVTREPTWQQAHYGFLGYCHGCGQFQTVGWKKLGRGLSCSCNAADSPVVSGPMWLGPLHNVSDLVAMQQIAATLAERSDSQWSECCDLLAVMRAEAEMPPYFYLLAEIGRRGKTEMPPRAARIDMLCDRGYEATRTHIHEPAIKTTAPMAVCLDISRQILRER